MNPLVAMWLPTALGTALLVSELPLVAVSAARSADPGRSLAALGIATAVLVVDGALGSAVSWCLVSLAPTPTGVAVRRYPHGRLIATGRTRPITTSLAGVAVGALSIVAGLVAEVVVLVLVSPCPRRW